MAGPGKEPGTSDVESDALPHALCDLAMTARVTLWRVHVMSLKRPYQQRVFKSNNVHFEGDKPQFKASYIKRNLTLLVISCDFLKLAEGSFHKNSYKMTTCIRHFMSFFQLT